MGKRIVLEPGVINAERQRVAWDDQLDGLLRKHYGVMDMGGLAKMIGCGIVAMRKRACAIGITKVYKNRVPVGTVRQYMRRGVLRDMIRTEKGWQLVNKHGQFGRPVLPVGTVKERRVQGKKREVIKTGDNSWRLVRLEQKARVKSTGSVATVAINPVQEIKIRKEEGGMWVQVDRKKWVYKKLISNFQCENFQLGGGVCK